MNKIKKIWSFIWDFSSLNAILNLITPFIVVIFDKHGYEINYPIDKNSFYIIVAYLILLVNIIMVIITRIRSFNIYKLKEELKCYKEIVIKTSDNITEEKIRNRLIQYTKKLGFLGFKNKVDRITVYATLENGFYALSRYSLNPLYNRIKKDQVYDFKKGCIAKGYVDSFFCEDGKNIPNPKEDYDGYKKYMKDKYNYTNAEIDDITMHSMYYAVHKIYKQDKCLGVIVLESEEKCRFNEEQAKYNLKRLAAILYPFLDLLNIKTKNLIDDSKKQLNKSKNKKRKRKKKKIKKNDK